MRKLLFVPPILVSLAVVACGGGQTDLSARDITDEELSLMVLSLTELGPQYADFEFDEDESGFRSNEDAIDDAFDPDDEEEDIKRFGRLKGYADIYSSLAALIDAEGVFFIGTSVSLYETTDGASGDLRDEVDDSMGQIGTVSDNVTLEDAAEFEADGIGDGSAGLVLTLSVSGDQKLTFYGTLVGFQRGRLIGSSIIARFDDEDVRDEAAALAGKLDERILAALRGEVTPTPRPTPEPTPTLDSAPTPEAGRAPSQFLESFRYTGLISIEANGGIAVASEGEFQAPDRLTCTVDVSVGGISFREEVSVIGGEAWLDTGEGFEATSADDREVLDTLDQCPGSPTFWQDFDLSFLEGLSGQPDMVNGIATTHYALGEAAAALGSIGFLPPELQGVTINAFDVWVAEEGGWVTVFNFDVSGDGEAFARAFGLPLTEHGSQQAGITMRVEITDANSPDIQVEPPIP